MKRDATMWLIFTKVSSIKYFVRWPRGQTNTDVSLVSTRATKRRRRKKKERKEAGKETRVTLHSNKLISPEHPAFSIYRKRETRNPDDWLWGEGVTFVLAGVAASPLTAVLISFRYPDLPKVLPSLALLIPDTLAAAVILYPWYRERERERERETCICTC